MFLLYKEERKKNDQILPFLTNTIALWENSAFRAQIPLHICSFGIRGNRKMHSALLHVSFARRHILLVF